MTRYNSSRNVSGSHGQRFQLTCACMVENHHRKPRKQNNSRTGHGWFGTIQDVLHCYTHLASKYVQIQLRALSHIHKCMVATQVSHASPTSYAKFSNLLEWLVMPRALLTSGLVENKVCNVIALVWLDLRPHHSCNM